MISRKYGLAPQAVARRLFLIDLDRDERASQICAEALLTIIANGYAKPPDRKTASPKLRRFALRSLIFGENFLFGYSEPVNNGDMTVEKYGSLLAGGTDFQGADNLVLARTALENLVDPTTEQGRPSQHLMLPFHESLLWYDSRSSGGRYTVRKVRMRGSGITVAAMLLDPNERAEKGAENSARLLKGLKECLSSQSPLSLIATRLESELPGHILAPPRREDDEQQSWELAHNDSLSPLTESVCRHCEGIFCQGGASPAAKLWQFRSIVALDLATNALRRAWAAKSEPFDRRRILAAIPGPERRRDRVRLRAERSLQDSRTAIQWATVSTLAEKMRELAHWGPPVSWASEVDPRTATLLKDQVLVPLEKARGGDYLTLAQRAFELANYDRSGEGFRVLIDSIGMTGGGAQYRYFTASPDLLSALVGALSAEMPMTSAEFFERIGREWGIVVSPEAAGGSVFARELEGADLAVNSRRFERVLIDAGLASGLSDRTVLVGEQAGRRDP